MKRVVLSLVAVLVLIALPAAAQYDDQTPAQPATGTEPTTATQPATGVTTTSPMPEERTNPAVPTHSNDPGLTATGTVVSWNDDEVVLRTSTGLTHIKLLPTTVGSRTFTEGQKLSVDFTRNEQGVLLAKQIRSAEVMTSMPQGITTSGAAAAGEQVESAAQNVGEAVEEGVEETLQADVDNDGAIGTRGGTSGSDTASTATTTTTSVDTSSNLPATGSNSPLIALLGLAALGTAAGIRRL
jgi:LPXTG-motif cell wall-anchored protein